MTMELETFLQLSHDEVARIVAESGPRVCVFPINGTRRWFFLEYGAQDEANLSSCYVEATIQRHIELYQMFFEHGIQTLLTPTMGPDVVERGESYMHMAVDGLSQLASHPSFLSFFQRFQVRVRFYGDYRKYLGATRYAGICDRFDEVVALTSDNRRHRLFFGLFANNPAETVVDLAVTYYAQHGHAPDYRKIVELYYGEYVDPVSLFIGFDKLAAYDMPLIALGNEDLYFTVNPSPYLTERQLREILFDHLYTRQAEEPDYSQISAEEWESVRALYQANEGKTMGIGVVGPGGLWYPLPYVEPPSKAFRQSPGM